MKKFEHLSSTQAKIAVIINAILIASHTIQFIRSDFFYKPAIYLALCTMFFFSIMFFGERFLSECFVCASLGFMVCGRFDCPAPVMLLCVAIFLCHSRRIVYICVYLTAWIAMMLYYDDAFTHTLIHLCGCTLALVVEHQVEIIVKRKDAEISRLKEEIDRLNESAEKPVPLDLTHDEIIIIQQIADGAEIKEIIEFSQNTVYAKLKEARLRNGIEKNWELISRYKSSQ